MNELKVSQQAGVISTNLDAIKEEITQQMAQYKDYTVTEDSVKDDKKVLADLRKLEKSLDDSRKSVKKLWMQPFDEFEGRCKEVIALVKEPIELINTQIKMFDEEKANVKAVHIKELYDANIQGLERFLPFEKVMESNPKWLNVSVKDQDILFDLNAMVLKVKNDLNAISALNSEIENDCIDVYAKNGNDLASAIARNSQYISDKAKVVEQVKEAEKSVKPPVEKAVEPNPIQQMYEQAQQEQVVHFIVDKKDEEDVENLLILGGIKFRKE